MPAATSGDAGDATPTADAQRKPPALRVGTIAGATGRAPRSSPNAASSGSSSGSGKAAAVQRQGWVSATYAIVHAFMSNTQALVFLMFCLNAMVNASVVAIVYVVPPTGSSVRSLTSTLRQPAHAVVCLLVV